MKIRTGFVSNSSSSSFVVLLPKNFEADTYQLTANDIDAMQDITEDECKIALRKLTTDGHFYEADEPNAFCVLSFIVKPYTIIEIDGGSDRGVIVLADRDKIEALLK